MIFRTGMCCIEHTSTRSEMPGANIWWLERGAWTPNKLKELSSKSLKKQLSLGGEILAFPFPGREQTQSEAIDICFHIFAFTLEYQTISYCGKIKLEKINNSEQVPNMSNYDAYKLLNFNPVFSLNIVYGNAIYRL